jgi:hypothetical protein
VSGVPEKLRGVCVRGTRKVERGRCPRYQKGLEGRMSAVPERVRGEGVRGTRKV